MKSYLMAPSSLLILLCLLLLSSAALTHGADDDADKPIYDFTHVCDEARYRNLGLDMTRFAYCDKSLSYYDRARSLINSMTLREKAGQLGNTVEGWLAQTSGVPRLGLPKYNWWSEALHGVANVGGGTKFSKQVPGATSFPSPISLAASFNETLWRSMAEVISTEARAMNNLGLAGLTFWSPNINVVRDPRWGRSLETPGEDPYVVGRYAVNFVRGLQDVPGQEHAEDMNLRPLKVSACCKHYAAYDLDFWPPAPAGSQGFITRNRFDANVTEQDMVETFVRPFEMCVKEGDVSSVMCSFNQVNGLPACADARLLRGTIRNDFNLHGYIVSDCDSIKIIVNDQKFLSDRPEDGVAQALKAGLDLDCGNSYNDHLESAALQGLVKESDIDQALLNNFVMLFRLGWFDGQPEYKDLDARHVCSPEHIKLAREAGRQGLVLLKNEGNALPLSTTKHKSVAVVGPHANGTDVMIGNYNGIPCGIVSPAEGLKQYASKVSMELGCEDVICRSQEAIWTAVRVARDADATIIVAGLSLAVEREEYDRANFDLPGYQSRLIEQVAALSKGPVILVIMSGAGVDVASFQKSKDIDAIIWAGYPGEQGGAAIADVIYGAHNPGGRLPLTWYPSEYINQIPMTSMHLRPVDGRPGRTYKFYDGPVVYPFGYGLSYTSFSYKVVSTQKRVDKQLPGHKHCVQLHYNQTAYVSSCNAALVGDLECEADDISVVVNVANAGKVRGTDVVMLYSRAPGGILGAPIKQVIGFQPVTLEAGQSKDVEFRLNSCKSLSLVTESAYVALPSGQHTIVVGDGDNAVSFPFQVNVKSTSAM